MRDICVLLTYLLIYLLTDSRLRFPVTFSGQVVHTPAPPSLFIKQYTVISYRCIIKQVRVCRPRHCGVTDSECGTPARKARMQIGSHRSASLTFQHSTAISIRIPVSDLTSLAGNSKSTRAVEEFHSDIQMSTGRVQLDRRPKLQKWDRHCSLLHTE